MSSETGNLPKKSCLYCKHFTKVNRDYGYCDLMMMLPPNKLPKELRRTRVSFSTFGCDDKGANVWVGVIFSCMYFEAKEDEVKYNCNNENNNEPDNFDIVF